MSNLYIRLKTGFFSNLKTLRLRARIGDDAFWIPPRLWTYAAENKTDGDFSTFTSEELASLLGCDKYATSIRQALVDVGFLDLDGKIHGWGEHNAYHETYKSRARAAADVRWAPHRAKKEKKQKKENTEKETLKGKEEQASPSDASSNASSMKSKGTEDEVVTYVLSLELPESDAHWFFWKCEGNGWTNNKQPIKNWRATIRSWKAGGYLPSQKSAGRNGAMRVPEPNQLQEQITIKTL